MKQAKKYVYGFDNVLDMWVLPFSVKVGGMLVPNKVALVDRTDNVISIVSNRYRSISNRSLVSAVETAIMSTVDSEFERGQAKYHNGVAMFEWRLPQYTFKVSGDRSDIMPTIVLRHDMRGKGAIIMHVGLFRVDCLNGIGPSLWKHTMRFPHNKNLTPDNIYDAAARELSFAIDDARALRYLAAERATYQGIETWDKAVAYAMGKIKKSRQTMFDEAITHYAYELGHTEWAVIQAVTDVATHQVPSTFGADKWAADIVAGLLERKWNNA